VSGGNGGLLFEVAGDLVAALGEQEPGIAAIRARRAVGDVAIGVLTMTPARRILVALDLEWQRPVALRGLRDALAPHGEIAPDPSRLGRQAQASLLAILRSAITPMLGLATHGPPSPLAR